MITDQLVAYDNIGIVSIEKAEKCDEKSPLVCGGEDLGGKFGAGFAFEPWRIFSNRPYNSVRDRRLFIGRCRAVDYVYGQSG